MRAKCVVAVVGREGGRVGPIRAHVWRRRGREGEKRSGRRRRRRHAQRKKKERLASEVLSPRERGGGEREREKERGGREDRGLGRKAEEGGPGAARNHTPSRASNRVDVVADRARFKMNSSVS